jgi:predicted dehydrogenase
MHAEYAIRAARAGKHVLCEKPMANTVEECRRMIAECRAAGRKLMVAYRVRYEPYNQAAIALARSGELGPIKVIADDHGFPIAGEPRQWRLTRALGGGGALMDIGVYGVQAARYLTGEEPIEARATMWSTDDPRFREVEETVAYQLTFPSGVVASCTASYGYAHQNRYRVVCADGWFELEPATSYRGLRMFVRRGGTPSVTAAIEERRFAEVDHFVREMEHFAECVTEGKEPLTPGEEGLHDIAVIEKIYEAAETGGPVPISASF